MVVLDTCAVIELCKSKPGLKKGTLRHIEQGVSILSVSFAEMLLKEKKGRLILEPNTQSLYEYYRNLPEVTIASLGVAEWLDAIHLDWKHQDPADRLIVGYALRKHLPIVTSDEKIRSFYKNTLW